MRRSIVALVLALALPLPALAAEVTVKPGETLSEIADRLGISIGQLMRLNGISKADHVEVGQKLKLPTTARSRAGAGAPGRLTVREGDTLSEIANRQGMELGQLMALNGLSKADHVEVGQTLKVTGRPSPAASAPSSSGSSNSAPRYRRGASEHVVRSGESLSAIADGYGVGMGQLVAINGIADPDHVEVGSRLKLKGEAPRPVPTRTQTPTPRSIAPRPAASAAPLQALAPRPNPEPAARPSSAAALAPAPAATSSYLPASSSVVAARSLAASSPVAATNSLTSTSSFASTNAVAAARPAAYPMAAPAAMSTPAAMATPTAMASPTSYRSQAMAAVSQPTRPATVGLATSPALAPRAAAVPIATAAPVATAPSPRPAARSPRPVAATPATVATTGWRRYGPLQVDWANWQPMGGSLVAPILNAKGDTLYLAINCGARKLNATSVAGDWRTWDDPQAEFERRLVSDLCSSRG
jgi:LysM repeat protein